MAKKTKLFRDGAKRKSLFTANAKFSIAPPAVEGDSKPVTLTGYAMVWNVLSSDRGGYFVRLLPGSAKMTTPALALYNHEGAKVIGSTANGTLRCTPDDVGLRVEIDLPETSYAEDVEELVEAGYVGGMSFSMLYSDAFEFRESREAGQDIMEIVAFECDEVSVVASPAFEETTVSVTQDDEIEDEPQQMARVSQSLRLDSFKFDLLLRTAE